MLLLVLNQKKKGNKPTMSNEKATVTLTLVNGFSVNGKMEVDSAGVITLSDYIVFNAAGDVHNDSADSGGRYITIVNTKVLYIEHKELL